MGKPACGLYGLNTIFAWSKSNVDGRISLGGVSEDNIRHAVMLENNYDPRHHFTMDASGRRAGRTTLEAPGGMTVKLGQECDEGVGTFNIQVENGNLNIDVQDGDLNVKATNINFEARGDTNEVGNFTCFANQKIEFESSLIKMTGTQTLTIQSNNLLRLLGDVETDFITGICNMNSYSSRRGKKGEAQEEVEGQVS